MSVHVLSWVLRHSEAEGSARLVLIVLADHAGNEGTDAFPSVATIETEARLSRRAVQMALRKLEDDGHIIEAGKGAKGQTNWTVLMGGAQNMRGGANDAPGGAQDMRGGGRKICAGGGAEYAPKPSLEPSLEPSIAQAQGSLIEEPPPSDGQGGKLFDAPSPEALVWEHWQKATATRQQLDSTRRGVIRNALKVRTVEQCCEAIDGLVADPWWRENRPKLELRYALRGNHAKGESDEDRIDKMREKAPHVQSSNGPMTGSQLLANVPSERHHIIQAEMSAVVVAIRRGGRSEESEARVAQWTNGGKPVIVDGEFKGWTR